MPFVLHKSFGGHHDNILSLFWSPDSKAFGDRLCGSESPGVHGGSSLESTSVRALLNLDTDDEGEGKQETRYKASTLAGHRDNIGLLFYE